MVSPSTEPCISSAAKDQTSTQPCCCKQCFNVREHDRHAFLHDCILSAAFCAPSPALYSACALQQLVYKRCFSTERKPSQR